MSDQSIDKVLENFEESRAAVAAIADLKNHPPVMTGALSYTFEKVLRLVSYDHPDVCAFDMARGVYNRAYGKDGQDAAWTALLEAAEKLATAVQEAQFPDGDAP